MILMISWLKIRYRLVFFMSKKPLSPPVITKPPSKLLCFFVGADAPYHKLVNFHLNKLKRRKIAQQPTHKPVLTILIFLFSNVQHSNESNLGQSFSINGKI